MNENRKAWTTELRTTHRPQAQGALRDRVPSGEDRSFVTGYCCLGIGEGVRLGYNNIPRATLPTRDFAEWIGLHVPDEWSPTTAIDPVIDTGWDRNLLRDRQGVPYEWTCSALNDDYHFTFPQIADIIDYFGLDGAA